MRTRMEGDLDEIIPTSVTNCVYNTENKHFTATNSGAHINLSLTVYLN